MPARDNWLKLYQQYVAESESPESFHVWTALSVLASTVRRNVFIDQGIYIVYPNMFIVLVGEAGVVAKSTAIRLGRALLLEVEDIQFGADSLTREELIQNMGKISQGAKDAAITLHSSELSSLIDPSGVKMVQFLTDIYDGDIRWRYSTKGAGRDDIRKPVVNILAGTTPSWLAEDMPINIVEHGFAARVIFIFEDEPRFDNPFPKNPPATIIRQLVNDLGNIAQIKGQFTYGGGAREVYKNLYKRLRKEKPEDHRLMSFHNRKRTHILKVSMLLSIAESDNLVVEAKHIKTAWRLLKSLEHKMPRVFAAVGKYSHATDLERIQEQFVRSGGMTPAEFLEKNRAVGDYKKLTEIITMLIAMRKIERVKDGNSIIYRPISLTRQALSHLIEPLGSEESAPPPADSEEALDSQSAERQTPQKTGPEP